MSEYKYYDQDHVRIKKPLCFEMKEHKQRIEQKTGRASLSAMH